MNNDKHKMIEAYAKIQDELESLKLKQTEGSPIDEALDYLINTIIADEIEFWETKPE